MTLQICNVIFTHSIFELEAEDSRDNSCEDTSWKGYLECKIRWKKLFDPNKDEEHLRVEMKYLGEKKRFSQSLIRIRHRPEKDVAIEPELRWWG